MSRQFQKSPELQALEDAQIQRLLDQSMMSRTQAAIMRKDSPGWAKVADMQATDDLVRAFEIENPRGAKVLTVVLLVAIFGCIILAIGSVGKDELWFWVRSFLGIGF